MCERAHEYDYLVVVGGDGMIALGANAVGCSGKPLGIVATGSGNDFARGLKLPVNRIETYAGDVDDVEVMGTAGFLQQTQYLRVHLSATAFG